MYCPKCKKDVGKTEFCEICGAATIDNLVNEESAATTAEMCNDDLITFDNIKNTVKKVNVKKLIILAFVAIIAIALFIGYKSLNFYTSPEQTVKRYVEALVEGDYKTAYSMIEGTNDSFLTEEYFEKFIDYRKIEGKNIVSVHQTMNNMDDTYSSFFGTIEEKDKIKEDQSKYFTAQIDTNFLEIVLVKRGKMYKLFDSWKIDTKNFVIEWDITVPNGTKVAIDGKTIERIKETNVYDKNNLFGTPAKETLTFYVDKMFPGTYELTATMEGGKDIKVQALTDKSQNLNFQPTDILVQDLREVADKILSIYYSNGDKNSFEGFVNPESQFINNLNNMWYDNRSNCENLKLNSISTTNTSIYDVDHAQLIVNAKFQYEKEVFDWSDWNNKKTEIVNDERTFNLLFTKVDDKWIVDEINIG